MRVGVSETIHEGDTTVTFTERNVKVGESVEFFSVLGQYMGAHPIAYGKVIGCCADEPGAPISPTHAGKTANAWRNYYRILVTKIL